MKRLVRFVLLASLLAAAAAAVRALRREQDPLPAPPDGPSGGPWPPLQNPSPAPPGPVERPAAPRAASKVSPQAPAPTDSDTPDEAVTPEPGGIPVGTDASSTWVEPTAAGSCPEGYPVKAKLSSKIFHSPGQLNYDRTTPDRCYTSTDAAEADGLRAAKR